jgi:hypothetical protein
MPDDTVKIEGTTILFRNFRGEEKRYNPAGRRNFAIVLDDRLAEMMMRDGWNVKQLKPREDEEEDVPPPYFIEVKIRYDVGRPPRVMMITYRDGQPVKTDLKEDTVEVLDSVDIQSADVIIRAFPWTQPNGESRITAYLKTLVVIVEEDELEAKYAELDRQ